MTLLAAALRSLRTEGHVAARPQLAPERTLRHGTKALSSPPWEPRANWLREGPACVRIVHTSYAQGETQSESMEGRVGAHMKNVGEGAV